MTSRRFDSAPRAIARLQRRLDDLWKLASRKGHGHVLAYATRETSGSGVTTEADLSGLSVTVTVPANRVIRVSGIVHIQSTSASDRSILRVYEDATQIQSLTTDHEQASTPGRVIYTPVAISTPGAGSVTYKFTLEGAVGTVNLVGATGTANHIVVEDLGSV